MAIGRALVGNASGREEAPQGGLVRRRLSAADGRPSRWCRAQGKADFLARTDFQAGSRLREQRALGGTGPRAPPLSCAHNALGCECANADTAKVKRGADHEDDCVCPARTFRSCGLRRDGKCRPIRRERLALSRPRQPRWPKPVRLSDEQKTRARVGPSAFFYAAFLRLASRRASTSATVASIVGCARPFCLAINCTSLSARSI